MSRMIFRGIASFFAFRPVWRLPGLSAGLFRRRSPPGPKQPRRPMRASGAGWGFGFRGQSRSSSSWTAAVRLSRSSRNQRKATGR